MVASGGRRIGGPGRIVTFYSYKGGTGRTMAVANIAWILASNGHRVLVVDWDLESPGLHRFFHPMLADPQLHASDGVIDLIREFAAAAIADQPQPGTTSPAARPDVRRYAVSLDWRFGGGGELDLLPAGRQGPAYSATVSTFDWPSFYERLGGAAFLADLRENLRDHYDYVLIDSRTGLSDSAGICTVVLPDTVVNCFTLSTQSIDGAVAVARSIRNQRLDDPVRILPVPMRVEEGEQSKLDAGRDHAWVRFAPFLDDLDPQAMARYWVEVEIPYKVFYAYEEILTVFGDRAHQPGTLLAAYERLAAVVSGEQLQRSPLLEESVRRYWLARFERTRPRAMSRVLVSYAAEDRMWAEWIAGVLSRVGLTTVLIEVASPDPVEPPEPGVDLAVVLLSTSYQLSEDTWALLHRAVTAAPGRGRSSVLPVSVDGTPPPEQLERYGSLDLAGMPAERAAAALMTALNWPAGELTGPDTPGDTLPRFPGTQPRVTRVFRRNANFTGRRRLLAAVRERLAAASSLALTGLGGVGKTQIALEYAHRFAADYDVVWFISAAQTSMLRADLVDLADALAVPEADTTVERIRLLRDALERGRPYRRWLLIVDNAGEPEDLRDILPTGPGHVLVTARSPVWGESEEAIEVAPFGREESIALLRLRMPALTSSDADRVAELLGDLPLAVEQASAWLAATAMPVDRYLALVERQASRLLVERTPSGYVQQAGRVTWLLALDQLRAEAPAAARLVELLAFFGPEPIPAALLYSPALIGVVSGDDPGLRDEVEFGRLVTLATRYALVSSDEVQGSLQMHRLVQAVVRESTPAEASRRYRRQVHEVLVAVNPGNTERPENWPAFGRLLPHVVPSGAVHAREDSVRQLLLDVVRYLYRRGDYAGSAELAEAVLRSWGAVSPADDLRLLVAKIFLANAVRSQGRYDTARQLDEEAYAGFMRTVGPLNQYSVMCMAGLAGDLWIAADYDRARELNEQALRVSTELFGPEDRRTFRAVNNLAVFMEQIGEYHEALRLHEQAFSGRRRLLGERHPEALTSAMPYGRVLRFVGDLRGSRRTLESALTGHRDVFGAEHTWTLRTSVELAATLRRLGEFGRAQVLARETYAVYQRTRLPAHADRLASANVLALALSATGNQVEAMALGMSSADRHADAFGAEHPFTLAVRSNVAVYLRRGGELDAARRLAGDLVEQMTAVLGPDHPYTLQSSVTAANARFACGEPAAALVVERDVFDRMTRVFGAAHPDRLVAGCNLAASRTSVGEVGSLAEFRAGLEATARRLLGQDHPITMAIRSGERVDCEIDLSQF